MKKVNIIKIKTGLNSNKNTPYFSYSSTIKYQNWHRVCDIIAKDNNRNELILELLKEDVKKGKKIVIPVDRIFHAEWFMDKLYESGISNYFVRGNTKGKIPKNGVDVLLITVPMLRCMYLRNESNSIYFVTPTPTKKRFFDVITRMYTDEDLDVNVFLDKNSFLHPTEKSLLVVKKMLLSEGLNVSKIKEVSLIKKKKTKAIPVPKRNVQCISCYFYKPVSEKICTKGLDTLSSKLCYEYLANEDVDLTNEYDICPDCKQKTIKAKELWEGGGVECINPNCSYWFCY